MKTLQEVIREQPVSARRKIAKRLDELIAQEMTMRELRKARKITQARLANSSVCGKNQTVWEILGSLFKKELERIARAVKCWQRYSLLAFLNSRWIYT